MFVAVLFVSVRDGIANTTGPFYSLCPLHVSEPDS